MTFEMLTKLLAPVKRRVANLVARAVVELVDDSKKLQILQISALADETRDGVERFQQYGFSSNPQTGAEAVVLFVNGDRSHGLAICVDDRRYRLQNLESGEVAIYTDEGDSIVLKRSGNIEVNASTRVTVNAPLVELAGESLIATDGLVHGTGIDTLTGATYSALGSSSTKVRGAK